ncbi:MAG: virulence RhuM family protein [Chitinivibrionia bacterium]|nr:virulence RhuM family protein [Chitinivibrionia bacterium]
MTKNKNEIIIYQSEDGQTKVEVLLNNDNVWLPLDKIAQIFGRDKSTVSRHIKNIFEDGELDKKATVANFATVQTEGTRQVMRDIEFYNLDMIISIGYRVNSQNGILFRKWATEILKEYIRKGFAMNDELLKEAGGGNYFKELISRIRDIRSSEKVFYRQILDIYATSVDYDPKSETSIEFFKLVQNKMHYAAHGKTAAELIVERASSELPFMGLTAFKGKKPTKNEAIIAKNYLNEKEIKALNLITSMYLDYAERQAQKEEVMYMKDWVVKLDTFLKNNDENILQNAGSVSREFAVEHANNEYDIYREKTKNELTQVEQDFLETIRATYKLLENKN